MIEHSDNRKTVLAAYEAFRTRDIETLLANFDPDIEWVHPDGMAPYGLGGVKRGHDGVRSFLATVPTVLGGMRLEPQQFVEDGQRIVVTGVRQVTSRRGTTRTLRFVHLWTMRDGRATRMEDVFDTVEFHQLIES